MKQKQKGFTLIELLVVIAIIGLLSTLAVVSLGAARSRARDAKRLADLRNVQNALELYASDQGTYPKQDTKLLSVNLSDGDCLDAVNGFMAGTTGAVAVCSKPLMVLKKDVVDPAKYAFQYQSDANGTKYVIFVALENKIGACALPEGITELTASGETTPDSATCVGMAGLTTAPTTP